MPPIMNNDDREAFGLAMAPVMRELMAAVKARLPEGTHYAILIEAQQGETCEVIAASTDRSRMALRAGEWVLSTLAHDAGIKVRG
jgi:hypothetical protein